MTLTLWIKIWRDLWLQRKQSIFVLLSISAGTFLLSTILITYAILMRELRSSYNELRTSTIQIGLEVPFNEDLFKKVADLPGVLAVDSRIQIAAEVVNDSGDNKKLRLFVLRDFENPRVDKFHLIEGRRRPKIGEIYIEKQAMSVLEANLGASLSVHVAGHKPAVFRLGGVIHDFGLPQAQWENIVYGYISYESLEFLGVQRNFDTLRIATTNDYDNLDEVEKLSLEITEHLQNLGYATTSVEALPPGKHPHENVTSGMFFIQKGFALICCLMGAVLVFNLVSAQLSRQLKQMALLKVIGAKEREIRYLYFIQILMLGLAGLISAFPLSVLIGIQYAAFLAEMMNLTLENLGVPIWVILVDILFALLLPVLAVYLPIRRSSLVSIKDSLSEYLPSKTNTSKSLFLALSRLSIWSVCSRIGIRNIARTLNRFIFTVVMFSLGLAVLSSAFHLTESMRQKVENDRVTKLWTANITLSKAFSQSQVSEFNNANPGTQIELTNIQVAIIEDERLNIPVKASVFQIQKNSEAFNLKILEGTWFSEGKSGVVISQLLAKKLPFKNIGDYIQINVDGVLSQHEILGVAEYISFPTLFMSDDLRYANSIFAYGDSTSIFAYLENNKLTTKHVVYSADIMKIIEGHYQIVFNTLLVLTVIILFISVNGMILNCSINVYERRKELATMKLLGADRKQLRTLLMTEALILAALSSLFGSVISIPLAFGMAYAVGSLLIHSPISLSVDISAISCSFPLVLFISVAASLFSERSMNAISINSQLE